MSPFIAAETGFDFKMVQESQSLSRHLGTIRGLHFQRALFAQAKIVRAVGGNRFGRSRP